jgi:activating signal cointegrator complex subunit 1
MGKDLAKGYPFDAREIISQHGTRDWREHMIMEAHLSQLFVYDKDGYYHCCGSIQFPFTPIGVFPFE